MKNDERDKILIDINAKLSEIDVQVKETHKAIFGNGHAGLNERVLRLEEKHNSGNRFGKIAWVVIAFVVNTALALVALFKGSY